MQIYESSSRPARPSAPACALLLGLALLLTLAGCSGGDSEPPLAERGSAIFSANDGVHGREPWITDGTVAGTHLLKDVNTTDLGGTTADSAPSTFTPFGSWVYFLADSDSDGWDELWRTDGTEAGTVQVLEPGGQPLSPAWNLTAVGGLLYFNSDSDLTAGFPFDTQLWRTDSTQAGTLDVSTGSAVSDGETFDVSFLTELDGSVFMAGSVGGSSWLLVKSDGSTIEEVRTDPGGGAVSVSNAQWLAAVNGALYFSADGGTGDYELWTSGGTTATTHLLQNLVPAGPSYPQQITELGANIVFVVEESTYGRELWKSDGTATGGGLLKDTATGVAWGDPTQLTVANGLLFFRGSTGSAWELWKSDGTTAGTVTLPVPAPAPGGSYAAELQSEGTRVFFVGFDLAGKQLFVTSGGTPVPLGPAGDYCTSTITTASGYAVYGLLTVPDNFFQVWLSDGTEAGTVQVPGISPDIPCE